MEHVRLHHRTGQCDRCSCHGIRRMIFFLFFNLIKSLPIHCLPIHLFNSFSLFHCKIVGDSLVSIQRRLSSSVSSGSSDQIVASRIHHSNSSLDFHSVVQSPALRLPPYRHALFHLRNRWHAGKWFLCSLCPTFSTDFDRRPIRVDLEIFPSLNRSSILSFVRCVIVCFLASFLSRSL